MSIFNNKKVKVSIIAWDAAFRESAHTLTFFSNQKYDRSKIDLEFIWVDYYSSTILLKKKTAEYDFVHLLPLQNYMDSSWHLGVCVNRGVASSKGDLLIIIDGDIVVEDDFIEHVVENCNYDNLVTYFRRYDEHEKTSCDRSLNDVGYLDKNCILKNPTNYAGCFVLKKHMFTAVNGYEEHPVFSGPGMNAMEAYIRFRNAGYAIRWDDKKIFHPWHTLTGLSSIELDQRARLKTVKAEFPWVQPYAGIQQSWVTRCRELKLDSLASEDNVNKYLSEVPSINI